MMTSWCWLGFDQVSLPLPLGLSRILTQPSATKTKEYMRFAPIWQGGKYSNI